MTPPRVFNLEKKLINKQQNYILKELRKHTETVFIINGFDSSCEEVILDVLEAHEIYSSQAQVCNWEQS